jgi:uncharacterized protein (TIGR02444 family)
MTISRADLEADSWAFAFDIYARPGVADACLKLQGEAGVDVMMFLFIAFAAVQLRILLTPAEISELDEVCRPWREQIVWPLRAIRSRLKKGPLPAPSHEREQFRSKIKVAEVEAERLQNQLLAEHLAKLMADRPPQGKPKQLTVDADELRSVLRSVVMLFLERCGNKPIGDLVRSIDEIVDAVIRGAR